MTVLGRGITGLPLATNSLMIGIGGLIDELPVGDIGQVLTVDGTGDVNWVDVAGGGAGTITGATNLPGGGAGVFAQDNANVLEFKTIAAGAGIVISQNANEVIVTNTAGASVTSVNGQSGVVVLDLDDINDVIFGVAPVANDVLTFNSGTNNWEAAQPPGASGGEANDGSNVGTGIEIFAQKVGVDLQFRSIDTVGGIAASSSPTSILLDTTAIDGTVTSIDVTDSSGGSDFIISGGPVTSSGSINMELAIIGSVAGSYTNPINISVDNKGRITAIANDAGGGTLDIYRTMIAGDATFSDASGESDSFTIVGDANLVTTIDNGTDTMTISLEDTGTPIGTFNLASVTVDAKGRVTGISTGSALQEVVDDTSPELGGDLALNGFGITSGGTILMTPGGGSYIDGPAAYDMSAGADETLATKKYVDDSIVASPTQDLYETFAADSGTSDAPSSPTDVFNITGDGGVISTFVSTDTLIISSTAIANVVDDTTPQLGGNLDVNGQSIITTAAGDIVLLPDTTGLVVAHVAYDMSAGPDYAFATKEYTDGLFGTAAESLSDLLDVDTAGLATNNLFYYNSGAAEWQPTADINIDSITFNDLGSNASKWTMTEDAGTNELLIQNGGVDAIRFKTNNGLEVAGPTTFNTVEYTWPGSDGTPGQLLTTDSAGGLTWSTVSGGAGSQNLWETISGDTGSTTADSVNDVLSIIGGTNITTVATANTLTINNSIDVLDDLSDVDLTAAPTTVNDVLKWNGTDNFESHTMLSLKTVDGDTGSFAALDIGDSITIGGGANVSTAVASDVLTITVDFEQGAKDNVELKDLKDMDPFLAPSVGQGIQWTGSQWNAVTLGGAQATWTTINGDGGLIVPPGAGTALNIIGNGVTTNASGDTITITNDISAISDLSDVGAAAPSAQDVLTFVGGEWIPQAPGAGGTQNLWETITADVGGSTAASTTTDTLEILGGTNVATTLNVSGSTSTVLIEVSNIPSVIDDLADVDTTTIAPTLDQVLTWNGSQWDPTTLPTAQFLWLTVNGDSGFASASSATDVLTIAGGTGITTEVTGDTLTINGSISVIDDLADVDTTGVAMGEILEWNGSQWSPTTNLGGVKDIYKTFIADSGSNSVASGETDTMTIAGGTAIATVNDGSGTITINTTALENVLADTTPQLGGDLDVNGNSIVSVSNGDVVIAPHGTGVANIGDMIHETKGQLVTSASTTAALVSYPVAYIGTFIDYVFKTSNGTQAGTLTVVNDGTNVSTSDTGAEIGTTDISFSAVVNASNIDVSYTEANGDTGNIAWVIRRMTI